MNRLAVRVTLKAVIFLLLATPALAQDDGDFGSDGGDDFFSGEGFGNQGPAAGPKIDPLVDLKNWLARVEAPPLDKKQEKPLNKLYEKEVKAMAKSFEKRFGVPLESAIATQNQGRGRRGGGQRRINPEETAEIRKLTSQLMDKIIAALRMDQQGPLRRYQSEQIRISRLNRIIENMAIAGLPIKPEQRPQVEELFARESRLRTLMIIEAKGKPYQTQVSLLETQTTQRIVRLLDQTQRSALVALMTKSTKSRTQ